METIFWHGEVGLSRLECEGKKYFWVEGENCDRGSGSGQFSLSDGRGSEESPNERVSKRPPGWDLGTDPNI